MTDPVECSGCSAAISHANSSGLCRSCNLRRIRDTPRLEALRLANHAAHFDPTLTIPDDDREMWDATRRRAAMNEARAVLKVERG